MDGGSTLKVELAGSATAEYDQLDATGPVSLGGASLDLSRSFTPAADGFLALHLGTAAPSVGTYVIVVQVGGLWVFG